MSSLLQSTAVGLTRGTHHVLTWFDDPKRLIISRPCGVVCFAVALQALLVLSSGYSTISGMVKGTTLVIKTILCLVPFGVAEDLSSLRAEVGSDVRTAIRQALVACTMPIMWVPFVRVFQVILGRGTPFSGLAEAWKSALRTEVPDLSQIVFPPPPPPSKGELTLTKLKSLRGTCLPQLKGTLLMLILTAGGLYVVGNIAFSGREAPSVDSEELIDLDSYLLPRPWQLTALVLATGLLPENPIQVVHQFKHNLLARLRARLDNSSTYTALRFAWSYYRGPS